MQLAQLKGVNSMIDINAAVVVSFMLIFTIKFIDQLLRVSYLLSVKKSHNHLATIIVGLQQMLHIYIIVYIVNDYSFHNVAALVTSTMLATYFVNKTFNQKEESDTNE